MLTADGALAADGPFRRVLAGFHPRPQQQDIAAEIARTINGYETLICEAGTGTGKTFAYLTPAVLSGRKVIISTGTRNLQEQLYHRDLPLVQEALGVPVRRALLKGRGNYLCQHRLGIHIADGRFPPETLHDLNHIRAWAGGTRSGDIAEVAEIPEDAPVWRLATSTVDNCLGQECPEYAECHVLRARRGAIAADLVVVNHHLFLADMALREEGFGELLPSADAVILDEAHQLPDLAVRFFGRSFGSNQLSELARDALSAERREAGDLPALCDAARRLDGAAREMRLALGPRPGRVSWAQVGEQRRVRETLEALQGTLAQLEEGLAGAAERGPDLQACHRRCRDLAARLELVAKRQDRDHVRWIELHARSFTWHASPLEVGELFAARLNAHKCAWIFTSATLAVDGRFDHFAERIGLRRRHERLWPSPFDFARQTLCYVPEGMPDPNRPEYDAAVCQVAGAVLEASRGRAFILFTSHRALEACAAVLRRRVRYPLLVQGGATRAELLRRFRSTPHAVLLGTGSFWEGVDVRGEALSCVIIDKLPFAAPDDPILRARFAAMREHGLDPFRRYQLPQAVIALKQGAGRLIRDARDRGVLVLCDPRVFTRSYGRVFLDSLPPMRRTRRLPDVRRFFAGVDVDIEPARH
ncbi:MAG: ATP-dependent DNA helicase [Gammaproteobacteria bacterium]|nr:ATP-dependent DNA helicase [Gammaproteobacteria bacterium]NIR85471.1 ATP-dependent DNA helicase [Gammaproteobacteria bacterium]NIR89523.1 ATP-dependent DNA helicase [Gammaproteobacteria bacterium]NIU06608.1 ATP-dependent DNA helicase [Gammaproteobacteria bacterium]NIV53491.1 DEAD/DEAH box helicase [Gammaproteobacteria bacterium]